MRNGGLEEAQAGIKIAGRNINNLRYADDTTLMAESELKSLLIKVKEESVLKLMSIMSVMTSNHLILCRHVLLPHSIFPSIRIFSKGLVLHIRWPKCWNFSFSISLSNEYSGMISFRMDWLDLLAT